MSKVSLKLYNEKFYFNQLPTHYTEDDVENKYSRRKYKINIFRWNNLFELKYFERIVAEWILGSDRYLAFETTLN